MKRLGQNQKKAMTDSLIAVFKKIPSLQEIDEMVRLAKSRLKREYQEIDNKSLAALFNQQVETLIRKGYHKVAKISKSAFVGHITPLKAKTFNVGKVGANHIPFLIVIPNLFIPITKQVPLIKFGKKKGFNALDVGALININQPKDPKIPYLIFDVEDGTYMTGISPDDSRKYFTEEKRRGLTVEEGIALIIQYSETLKNHGVDLPGCRWGSYHVPKIGIIDGYPKLSSGWKAAALDGWGSASCRESALVF